MDNKIINGVIWKQLFIFFFPIWFGTFFQQLYNTADAVIVGNFVGKGALAAVGATAVILNLLVGFFVGLSSGSSVIISQCYGSDDWQGVEDTVHTTMALSFLGGGLLTILGIISTDFCLRWIHIPADIFSEAKIYLMVCFLGMIPVFVYNMGTGILRAIGDSKRPLYFLIAASLTNIALDVVFVVYCHMGVLGVGLGTIISQLVSAVLTIISLSMSEECYRFEWKKMHFHWHIMKQIVHIGLPAGLQSVMYSLSNIVVQTSINGFGTDIVAAYTAYTKIDTIFWMTMNAFGLAITTFVGQNFGARKYDRVKKGIWQCVGLAFLTTLFLLAILLPFGSYFYQIFIHDEYVIQIGLDILYFLAPIWPSYILIEVLSGGVRGSGDSIIPMIITCSGVCVLRVVYILCFATPLWPTLKGVLMCYPISWTITSIMFLIYFVHGGWLKRRIRYTFGK